MGPGLHRPARGRAVKGLLAAGAEVKATAEARARCPPSLGRMLGRRAAVLAGTQGFVLLQTAGSLDGERQNLRFKCAT